MTDLLRDRVTVAVGELYDIQGEVGRGARSVVYRALDLRLHRPVAVKVLPPDLAFDRGVRERFLLEARTAASLDHPNIVPIHGVDERSGVAYLVMSLVDGESLGSRLGREPRPPLDEVRRILREVADALAHAHERGVVHRDIKPDNILLDRRTGRAMVTDFGIARATEAGSRLTVTGIAIGTPAYMSPEQAVGEHELDGRSDLYSLGVVGYQMLVGEVPFRATNAMALLMKHVTEPLPPIRERRPSVPPLLAAAVERAMAKRPADRWHDASVFRDAIARDDEHNLAARERPRDAGVRRRNPLPPAPALPAPGTVWGQRQERRDAREPDRAARRRERGPFSERPLPDRLRSFRRDLMGSGALIAGLAAINAVTTPFFPWFLFPAGGMMIGLGGKWASLWADGVRMRDILQPPRSSELDPIVPPAQRGADHALGKLAPAEVLDGAHGDAIRRAADDRAVITQIFQRLEPADRQLLPDIVPTVNALVERVASLAQMLHRIDVNLPPGVAEAADGRLAAVEREPAAPDRDRRLALLQRQRTTLRELAERRATLAGQLESAGLALANLRLDLLKLRSSGVQSALDEVATATQEARALSRDIGTALDAAADIRSL